MNPDLVSYYDKRAKEYDKVYLNPDEQNDLHESTRIFQDLFAQKSVLEIACGTGYWTAQIAQTATSIYATDINESVLEIAQERVANAGVTFAVADMYNLPANTRYDAVFGGFIWSHILLQDLDKFISTLKNVLKPGGVLAFIDSNPVKGAGHDLKRITHTDEQENTYQTRTLEDGTAHLVLKNFPTEAYLVQKLSSIATDINFVNLEFYWILTCKIKT